jgi:hypothetical protein
VASKNDPISENDSIIQMLRFNIEGRNYRDFFKDMPDPAPFYSGF